jgi:hypothetical protein
VAWGPPTNTVTVNLAHNKIVLASNKFIALQALKVEDFVIVKRDDKITMKNVSEKVLAADRASPKSPKLKAAVGKPKMAEGRSEFAGRFSDLPKAEQKAASWAEQLDL